MPPRGLPTLVVLPPVASSSVAPLSSASFCSATAACRSLALAASPASRRSSALLAAYCGPSSLSSSPLARTTLLTPTPIICRHVKLLLRSTLSSITCAFTDGVGTGVPLMNVVTADDGITTGVPHKPSAPPHRWDNTFSVYNCIFMPASRAGAQRRKRHGLAGVEQRLARGASRLRLSPR